MKGILVTGLLLFAITASANNFANDVNYPYLGLGGVFISYEGNLIGSSIPLQPGQRLNDDTTKLELYAGYQLSQYFSIELGYADLGKVSEEFTYTPDTAYIYIPHNIEKRQLKQISIRAFFEYPLENNINILGLVGYSYFDIEQTWTGGSALNTDFTDNFNENGLTYGLGGKYSFNNKYAGKLIWTKTETDDFNINAIYLLLERTFGRN